MKNADKSKIHPSLERLRVAAGRVETRATTVRGQMRACRGQLVDMGQRLTAKSWAARCADRALRGRYRDPREQAQDVIALLAEIWGALDRVQGRCSKRVLRVQDVLDHISHRTITPREYVSGGYKYRYTWTAAGAVLEECGTVVSWGVGRVSRMSDTPTSGHRVALRTVQGIAWGHALLNGDAIAVRARLGDYFIRYDWTGKRTGVAGEMPADMVGRWGQWEHAETVEALREEIARKREIMARDVEAKRESARQDRRARLFARLSGAALVRVETMRGAGACMAGIEAWARAHGRGLDQAVSLREVAVDQPVWAVRAARYLLRQQIVNA